MATVVVKGLLDLGDVGGFGTAEAEVVVLGAHEFGVEATDRLEEVGAHETEVKDHEFGEEAIFVVGNLAVFAVVFVAAVFVDDDVVGVDQADVGMGFEVVDGFGEGGFGEKVVAIDDTDVFSGGEGGGLCHGGATALVWGGDDADTGVLGGVMVADFEGVVGGAVVPEDEFEVWVGLGEDGFDRVGEVVFAVVEGGDEGDFGGVGVGGEGDWLGETEEGELGVVDLGGGEVFEGEFLVPAGEDGLFVGAVAVVEEEEGAGAQEMLKFVGGGIAGEGMAIARWAVDEDEVGGAWGNVGEVVPGVIVCGEGCVVEGGKGEIVGLEEGAGVVVPVEVVFEGEVLVDDALGLELGEAEGGLAGAAFDDGAAVVVFDDLGDVVEGGGGEAIGIGCGGRLGHGGWVSGR